VVVNSRGVEVNETERRPPVDGPPLTLTLDSRLQAAMEKAFAGRAGSAVAFDPRTGEVLAMTSTPAYDPNQFTNGVEQGVWARLTSDPETPLMNRVIQGQYAPGSTFKIIMAIAALEEGVITPSTTFFCPGQLGVYNTVFRCNRPGGHGAVDVHKALALSCNVFFYQVGIRLEIARIAAYAKRLGLGAPTGVDLPHEVAGLMPSPEWKLRVQKVPWYAGETVSVAIGQGQVSATLMQMARVTAVVANGGKLVRPHLVRAVGGQPVAAESPVDLGLKPATLEVVRRGMTAVVAEGTGWRARVPGLSVAGKTGSAQVVAKSRLEKTPTAVAILPHGWFVAFAPVENPRIALSVLVEHGGSGGEAAAPVAREILSTWFGLTGPTGPPGVTDTEVGD
jgi:penicillin-binding protein 2